MSTMLGESIITQVTVFCEGQKYPKNRLTEDLELLRHCRAELDELLEG